MDESLDLVAVITAAITALLEGKSNIVVKSIRRIPDNTPIWAMTGRQQQMSGRL